MLCWLVVDDSDVIRKVARRVLEDMHYMVLEAASGEEAIALCRKAMPQLILLDWHMPGINGHDFMDMLKLIKTDRPPVIVYCTTENDPIDLARAFTGGAQAYLMKPYNRPILEQKIQHVARLAA
jgi:two-component system, chemotaxis family, chemotaxis protein CheY